MQQRRVPLDGTLCFILLRLCYNRLREEWYPGGYPPTAAANKQHTPGETSPADTRLLQVTFGLPIHHLHLSVDSRVKFHVCHGVLCLPTAAANMQHMPGKTLPADTPGSCRSDLGCLCSSYICQLIAMSNFMSVMEYCVQLLLQVSSRCLGRRHLLTPGCCGSAYSRKNACRSTYSSWMRG